MGYLSMASAGYVSVIAVNQCAQFSNTQNSNTQYLDLTEEPSSPKGSGFFSRNDKPPWALRMSQSQGEASPLEPPPDFLLDTYSQSHRFPGKSMPLGGSQGG